jgi:hypothetical protein
MLTVGGAVHLSASDLVGHLNCRYLTSLDLAVANGTLAKPFIWDPVLEVLAERGALHEQDYVDHLKASGLLVTAVDGVGVDSSVVTQTLEAMKGGEQVIVQGALQAGHWSGRVDILRRVEKPSDLGSWSYEVVDTKLARETKGSTVLQVCLYSELLAAAQKRVATGNVHRSRQALNADTIREMHLAFQRGGRAAINKVMKTQPAAFLKLLVLLVPREMKVAHSGGVKAMTDEQIEAAIEAIQGMLEARAAGEGAKVIDAVPEPVALPAPSPKPRRKRGAEAKASPLLPDEQGESE